MMWDGFDQRKFPRIQVKCAVSVTLLKQPRTLHVLTENVGLGGVCIVLEEQLDRFMPVRVRLELVKSKVRFECGGHVAWSVASRQAKGRKAVFDTGIEFGSVDPDDFSKLEYFLRKHS